MIVLRDMSILNRPATAQYERLVRKEGEITRYRSSMVVHHLRGLIADSKVR